MGVAVCIVLTMCDAVLLAGIDLLLIHTEQDLVMPRTTASNAVYKHVSLTNVLQRMQGALAYSTKAGTSSCAMMIACVLSVV